MARGKKKINTKNTFLIALHIGKALVTHLLIQEIFTCQ